MCIPGNKTVLQVCTFSLIQVFGIAKKKERKKERKKEKCKPFKFVERNVRCLSVPTLTTSYVFADPTDLLTC